MHLNNGKATILVDESLQNQIETYRSHLDALIRRGHQLRHKLAVDPSDLLAVTAMRRWQEECGITINQLSGGSKAHWLARSFSEAFLMRSAEGSAVQESAPVAIVEQLLGVLEQGVASLAPSNEGAVISASTEVPAARRFEFVHHPQIRPVLEQAYADSRSALDQGDYELALVTSSGILEAIVTDALEHKGLAALMKTGAPATEISGWSFDTRLAVAEKAGLIRGGCARLPAVARTYRDRMDADGKTLPKGTISERDARRTGEVLHVIMKDLDPGR